MEHEWYGAFCSRCGADEASSFADSPCENADRQFAILLDVQTDWPEVVFVGTFDECDEYRRAVVSPIVESYGDEAIYYETTAIVHVGDALKALRERQDEDA